MGNRVNQSTVPTYIDESSLSSPMDNNTILFCESYGGVRKNLIVVDSSALLSEINSTGNCTIQTAYANSWIVDFPISSNTSRNYYKWELDVSEINAFNNFCLYQDVLDDTSKFFITEDGAPFSNWNLLNRRMHGAGSIYASHIGFLSTGGTKYVIHYWEDINEANTFSLRLNSNHATLPPRNKGIPLTISDRFGILYYLRDSTVNNKFHVKCTYTDFNGVEPDRIIDKTFSNMLSIKQYGLGEDLTAVSKPCFIEAWSSKGGTVGERSTSNNDYASSRSRRGQSIIVQNRNSNNFYLESMKPGYYKFRIRFADNTYSKWIEDKLEVRKTNVWDTDITVSNKNYKGFIYYPKLK